MGIEDREWYRKDSERRERAADKPRRYSPLAIALAMVAAAALSFAVLAWIVHSRAEAAAELRMRSVPNALQESQLEGQELLRESEDREAARQARLQQQEAQRLQAIAEQQRAEEEVRPLPDSQDRRLVARKLTVDPSAHCHRT